MSYTIDDTICAVSTPAGIGGIAVIRVSGHDAIKICDNVWVGSRLADAASHTAHLGEIVDKNITDGAIDQCVATVFRGPKSYTGEDTVELAVHGSRWVQREVLALLQRSGCRMAEPGEYTRRAVMNGRLDLAQAEGVADVIASSSRAAHRIAMRQMKGGISNKLSELREQLLQLSVLLELELDFSEEDVEFADRERLIVIAKNIQEELQRLYNSFSRGNAIKEGIPVAIIGATNAGKSSLLNALLDDDRAIVSNIHGTTRDTIEETLEIGDYLFRFIDTAGLRETNDPIERIGIDRSRKAISKARIVVVMVDSTDMICYEAVMSDNISTLLPEELSHAHYEEEAPNVIIGLNKVDMLSDVDRHKLEATLPRLAGNLPERYEILALSVKNKSGISELRECISRIAERQDATSGNDADIMITNLRQAEALRQAIEAIGPLIIGLETGLETDLVAQHLRETLSTLSAVTGTIPTTEILNTIFSSFCIGK